MRLGIGNIEIQVMKEFLESRLSQSDGEFELGYRQALGDLCGLIEAKLSEQMKYYFGVEE